MASCQAGGLPGLPWAWVKGSLCTEGLWSPAPAAPAELEELQCPGALTVPGQALAAASTLQGQHLQVILLQSVPGCCQERLGWEEQRE